MELRPLFSQGDSKFFTLFAVQLNPTLSGHTIAVRSKITRTAMKNESPKEAAPTDLCKRCNMLGHCTKNCTNPPEPEWLAKQECYKCGSFSAAQYTSLSRSIRESCRLPGNPVATDKKSSEESTIPCTK